MWMSELWLIHIHSYSLWSNSTILLVKYACTQEKVSKKYFKSTETIPCSDLFVLTYHEICFIKKAKKIYLKNHKKNIYWNRSAAHLTSHFPHKRPARRKNYKQNFFYYIQNIFITFQIFLLHSKYSCYIPNILLHSKYFSLYSKL